MSEPALGQSGKFIVGVTGNIATGKSVVMRLAAERGALTIDADRLVHELMDYDVEMQAAIAVAFGPELRRPDGRIDRRALGEIVFNDLDAMRDLEEMVHPAVRQELIQRIGRSKISLVFIEAIKLIESKLSDSCQQIWVTRCTKKQQLDRLRICRGMDTPSAATRIKAQPPQEDKVALADVVIDTGGYMVETMTQFERAWERLPESITSQLAAKPDVPAAPVIRSQEIAEAAPALPAATRQPVTPAETVETPEVKVPEPAIVDETQAETAEAIEEAPSVRSDDVEIRRARPSDIPSILLLIQKATDGKVKMKRAELLMALSERSYFIGQVGTDVSTVMGLGIDSQVARVDEVYVHPLETASDVAAAVVAEMEKSANAHICEIIVVFLSEDGPREVRQIFASQGYEASERDDLPQAWRKAIDESQPEDTFFLVKVLRRERLRET